MLESVREAEGNAPLGELYTEYGRRIHHDHDLFFDIGDALEAAGLDRSHAAAADDAQRWDPIIRADMDEGLTLAGDDIGTPLIALDDDDGERVAMFGPVISRVPEGEDRLRLWDGFVTLATMPGFWEAKRTRTEPPQFGERP
ncbi:MAG: hypothetical protein IH940_09075 [Acidobacteria bacterium]|nr:hypothetical protein [Acidobacteriota bacterium]